MKKWIYLVGALALGLPVMAQSKSGQQAINNLCGCFEVDFKYAETFAPDTAYTFHPRYHTWGLEYVVAEEATGRKYVLQHLLIIDDTTIIKHWREDWEYESAGLWNFEKDATWQYSSANSHLEKGTWKQTVWEVDDAPRYQGTGRWISSNNRNYWENTTDAPLPRREYSKRNDYNVLQRSNRIILTDTGWVHEQDNRKIIRKDNTPDKLLAEEKGYNIYRRTSDSKCLKAAQWWQGHKLFWKTVRESWETAMKDKSRFHLIPKVDGHFLYQQLDELEKQQLSVAQWKEKLNGLLEKYTTGKPEAPTTVKY